MKSRLRDIDFDGKDLDDLVINNNIFFGIKKNKTLFSLGFGREDWYLHYFENNYSTNPSIYNAHCRTYKVSTLLEQQFFLIKSKLSLNLGIGGKFYFLNQMKDSLSHTVYNGHSLSTLKPSALLKANDTYDNPYQGVGKEYYGYLTSVPFAFIANLALQYRFKKLGLKFYYEPYFIRINYKNAKDFRVGTKLAFYNNIGVAASYPLNFKKKDKQNSGLQ